MFSSQIDGSSFSLSQSSQSLDSSATKNRDGHGLVPMTVKQISDAFNSTDERSPFKVDTTNVRLLGLVMNKVERTTDVTFTLDDGTGRIDMIRWVNETSDANETAIIRNGMYITVNGSLKGFQDKKRAVAFSVRPVTDYNAVPHHFIQCIHAYICQTGQKAEGASQYPETSSMAVAPSNGSKDHQAQSSAGATTDGPETDIYKQVMNIFKEPVSLASDHGVHIDEVAKRLGIPINKIKEAIDYYVDIGYLYSTIDDYHFKSACE